MLSTPATNMPGGRRAAAATTRAKTVGNRPSSRDRHRQLPDHQDPAVQRAEARDRGADRDDAPPPSRRATCAPRRRTAPSSSRASSGGDDAHHADGADDVDRPRRASVPTIVARGIVRSGSRTRARESSRTRDRETPRASASRPASGRGRTRPRRRRRSRSAPARRTRGRRGRRRPAAESSATVVTTCTRPAARDAADVHAGEQPERRHREQRRGAGGDRTTPAGTDRGSRRTRRRAPRSRTRSRSSSPTRRESRRDRRTARRVYAYGPPAAGSSRASRAKTSASSTLPVAETTQPSRLTPPNGASEAGSRNTPDPIMLPMTSATAVQNPTTRSSPRPASPLSRSRRRTARPVPSTSFAATLRRQPADVLVGIELDDVGADQLAAERVEQREHFADRQAARLAMRDARARTPDRARRDRSRRRHGRRSTAARRRPRRACRSARRRIGCA